MSSSSAAVSTGAFAENRFQRGGSPSSAIRSSPAIGFGPEAPGFDHVPFGDLDAVRAAVGPETAAVMVEPVQGEGGVSVGSTEYLRGLRTLCDEAGILLVLDEVQTGVGRSGKLLDLMLNTIGLDRSKVYIANIVPWRPPGNRTPTPVETQICLPFIQRQIELADPDVADHGERDLRPLGVLLHPAAELEPVHLRHVRVGDDQIGNVLLQGRQRLGAVVGRGDVEAGFLEAHVEHPQALRVAVDQKEILLAQPGLHVSPPWTVTVPEGQRSLSAVDGTGNSASAAA